MPSCTRGWLVAKVVPVKERVRLEFLAFTPEKAGWMLEVARAWMVSGHERPAGLRNGGVYTSTQFVAFMSAQFVACAYWTSGRTLVVRELEPEVRHG
jgi:hypothetical protein